MENRLSVMESSMNIICQTTTNCPLREALFVIRRSNPPFFKVSEICTAAGLKPSLDSQMDWVPDFGNLAERIRDQIFIAECQKNCGGENVTYISPGGLFIRNCNNHHLEESVNRATWLIEFDWKAKNTRPVGIRA